MESINSIKLNQGQKTPKICETLVLKNIFGVVTQFSRIQYNNAI